MTGLLKNNFYASLSNLKLFLGSMFLLGIFVTAIDNDIPTLLIGYMLLSMVGFSLVSISGIGKENAGKWRKYKLTAPVRRKDIIKSYFASQLLWLAAGSVLAALCVSLSLFLHGFPFDKNTDILMIFLGGISISLFLDAVFFPSIHLGGEERNEVILVISLLFSAGVFMAFVSLLNWLFGPKQTLLQILLGAAVILACAITSFIASYFLTVYIFKRKE